MNKMAYHLGTFQLALTASFFIGRQEALAANTFSDVAENIITSIESLPGMLTGLAYIFGLLMGVTGILKLKDHVENPGQTPLKDGAIRLASGGALFALPIVYESMLNTIGLTTATVEPAQLNKVTFAVN